MLTSRDIYKMVEIEMKVNLRTVSRKRIFVYARGVANVLCKEFTEESFGEIGIITGLDHASVMNSVNAFLNTYIHYSKYHREAYLKLRQYILEVKLQESKDKIESENTGKPPLEDVEYIDLTHKYIELQNENALLKYRLKKRMQEFEEKQFKENPLIKLVNSIPPGKQEIAHLRIEAMVKML